MSRTPSTRARAAMFAQETGEAFLARLEISHPDLDDPIRVVSDFTNITSEGNVYTGIPFGFMLPGDSDENVPSAQVVLDNVSQEIIQAIRELNGPPEMNLAIILADTPDVIEAGPFTMKLQSVDYDAGSITGTLTYDSVLDEPYPGDFFTPSNFPGLF